MFNFKKNLLKTLILSLLPLLLWSCTGGSASSSFGMPISPNSPNGHVGSSDGTGSLSDFYVGIDAEANSIAHVHSATFQSKCAVAPGESLKDIKCYVETPEAEIFVKGITLKYNVPPGMCRYLRRKTYWFYNKEVGIGPANVVINKTVNASGDLTAVNCSVDGVPSATCTGYSEVSINAKDGVSTCVYDTSKNSTGANCCFGRKQQTINTLNSSTGVTTTDPQLTDWGGSFSSCIDGPGKNAWTSKSTQGVPQALIEKTENGVSKTYVLPALIGKTFTSTTIEIANYSTDAVHSHTGFGPVLTPAIPARTSALPYFLDPIDDRSGSKIPTETFDPSNFLVTAQDSYEFECLDEAFEVLHRIRLYIREWDTYQDYTTYVSSNGATAVDNRNGTEGATCNGIVGPCNDFYDLDDFVSLILGGPYDTSLGALSNRGRYFPNISH